jgi:hypothetical protein
MQGASAVLHNVEERYTSIDATMKLASSLTCVHNSKPRGPHETTGGDWDNLAC